MRVNGVSTGRTGTITVNRWLENEKTFLEFHRFFVHPSGNTDWDLDRSLQVFLTGSDKLDLVANKFGASYSITLTHAEARNLIDALITEPRAG